MNLKSSALRWSSLLLAIMVCVVSWYPLRAPLSQCLPLPLVSLYQPKESLPSLLHISSAFVRKQAP